MRKAVVIALAVTLTLGLGVGTADAAKAKRVSSEVDIDGYNSPPPTYEFRFVGNVYSKKAKCVPNRSVSLFLVNGGAHELVGSGTTDETGDWAIKPENLLAGGEYRAEVEKRKRKKGDKKLICKADVSPVFFIGT
jgi:hypothetical protein